MSRPKKIILIVVDTLRADHLGCYGYKRNTSPFIDEFAKECVFFEHAISPGSQTLPVHASIFTSKYIVHHSVGYDNYGKLDGDASITLAEVMQSMGYDTSGFISAFVLRGSTNINKGFSNYDDEMNASRKFNDKSVFRDGHETNERALQWIEKNKDRDFFLFIHYFDVHGPYINPFPYDRMFVGDPFYGDAKMLDHVPDYSPIGGIPCFRLLNCVRDAGGKLLSYEHDVRYYIAQYDGGIRYEDTVVRGFIEGLKKIGVYDESLIVLTADHGEGMGEFDVYFEHSTTVTPEKVHVPLMIKPDAGRSVERATVSMPVSTVDIMPTVLSLCEFDYRGFGLDGRPLGTIAGGGARERILLSETYTQYAMVYPNGKFLLKKNLKQNIGNALADDRVSDPAVRKVVEGLDSAVFSFGQGEADISSMNGSAMRDLEQIITTEQKCVQCAYEVSYLKALQKQFRDTISKNDSEISSLSRRVASLEEVLRERDNDMKRIQGEAESMRKSSAWQLIGWFDRRIVNPMMPPGSRRRLTYGWMIRSLRGIMNGR